jgi:hypothetical protein
MDPTATPIPSKNKKKPKADSGDENPLMFTSATSFSLLRIYYGKVRPTGRHCLGLVVPVEGGIRNNFVIADNQGRISCFSVSKGEVKVCSSRAFQNLASKSFVCLEGL